MKLRAAGYSGKPLAEKLGLKPGARAFVSGAPEGYERTLGAALKAAKVSRKLEGPLDWIHVFASDRKALKRLLPACRKALAPDGQLWVSWPKKASGVATDLGENVVRELGLARGVVDVKVAAVDPVWSGLKFVVRLKDRR